MAYLNNILLGRITRASGYEGGVAVKLDKAFIENIIVPESVFLEIEGRPVPFFVSDMEYSGAGLLKLWFRDYTSAENIKEFIGCRIFLTEGMADPISRKQDNQILIGYQVYAREGYLVGIISDVISNGGQWLLEVRSDSRKSILIPFHEDLVSGIDEKKKIVIMGIPDGLLEIN